ncbi:IclR family transcriptional regulator [Desulforhopalus singaporensis]|uniref:Transcriptional regulator, IclR family n=1 Tax=Desulforhopalus singaporensis TaxID=91360 RepID=A0A1H0SBM6_9BACT|nr:IclR family transcriptional regulator [Desulforhopalus singaporensis]SDP39163.1 transcriptional regulator, IclR family [Desulforhopalus singaporensis]
MKVNRTTLRATEILRLLATAPDGMTVTEIGTALKLPKTSTFDIVQTLRQVDFLREKGKRFFIGYMAGEVGRAYAAEQEIDEVASPHIVALAEKLQMVGSLVLYENGSLNYVFEHSPPGSIIAPGASGGTSYVHASASGKVLIANMPAARQTKAMASLRFTAFTDNTIMDAGTYKREIKKVQEQGYAVDDREFHKFLTCVSAPIFNRGKVAAAITMSGLQVDNEAIEDIASQLVVTARVISAELSETR